MGEKALGRGGNKGRRTGRTPKLTDERRQIILGAIEAGCTREYAAQAAGIGRTTLFTWLQKGEANQAPIYRDFWNAVKKAEAVCVEAMLGLIREHAIRDWKAAAWLLERRFGYASPQALAMIEKARQDKPNPSATDGADDIRKGVQQLQEAGGIDAALEDPGEAA